MLVKWIPTTQQQGDGLTKILHRQQFEKFVTEIGLQFPSCKASEPPDNILDRSQVQ